MRYIAEIFAAVTKTMTYRLEIMQLKVKTLSKYAFWKQKNGKITKEISNILLTFVSSEFTSFNTR